MVFRVNGKVIAEEPFDEVLRIIAEEKLKGPLTIGVLRPYICYNRKIGRLLFAAIIIFLCKLFSILKSCLLNCLINRKNYPFCSAGVLE